MIFVTLSPGKQNEMRRAKLNDINRKFSSISFISPCIGVTYLSCAVRLYKLATLTLKNIRNLPYQINTLLVT